MPPRQRQRDLRDAQEWRGELGEKLSKLKDPKKVWDKSKELAGKSRDLVGRPIKNVIGRLKTERWGYVGDLEELGSALVMGETGGTEEAQVGDEDRLSPGKVARGVLDKKRSDRISFLEDMGEKVSEGGLNTGDKERLKRFFEAYYSGSDRRPSGEEKEKIIEPYAELADINQGQAENALGEWRNHYQSQLKPLSRREITRRSRDLEDADGIKLDFGSDAVGDGYMRVKFKGEGILDRALHGGAIEVTSLSNMAVHNGDLYVKEFEVGEDGSNKITYTQIRKDGFEEVEGENLPGEVKDRFAVEKDRQFTDARTSTQNERETTGGEQAPPQEGVSDTAEAEASEEQDTRGETGGQTNNQEEEEIYPFEIIEGDKVDISEEKVVLTEEGGEGMEQGVEAGQFLRGFETRIDENNGLAHARMEEDEEGEYLSLEMGNDSTINIHGEDLIETAKGSISDKIGERLTSNLGQETPNYEKVVQLMEVLGPVKAAKAVDGVETEKITDLTRKSREEGGGKEIYEDGLSKEFRNEFGEKIGGGRDVWEMD